MSENTNGAPKARILEAFSEFAETGRRGTGSVIGAPEQTSHSSSHCQPSLDTSQSETPGVPVLNSFVFVDTTPSATACRMSTVSKTSLQDVVLMAVYPSIRDLFLRITAFR